MPQQQQGGKRSTILPAWKGWKKEDIPSPLIQFPSNFNINQFKYKMYSKEYTQNQFPLPTPQIQTIRT